MKDIDKSDAPLGYIAVTPMRGMGATVKLNVATSLVKYASIK